MTRLKINGTWKEVQADPNTPLLWVIRDNLGLTGTKYGCGVAECGACTVHMDGEAVLSCSITLQEAANRSVVTIEGLNDGVGASLKKAWIEEDVPQCGYCQPGQIMTAADLLRRHPSPSDQQIDRGMSGVLCRCGSYHEIRKAVKRAALEAENEKG